MKKEDTLYVKVDSRNRITVPKKLAKNIAKLYKVHEKDGNIVLEPVHEASKDEQWLHDPKNQAILARLKEESSRENQHKPPTQQQPTQDNKPNNQHSQTQQNNLHNASNNTGSHNDKK